jgi:hypothetical protein
MNDKFLEILSKSSGRTITRPYDGSLLIKLDLPELEKFAELIVKEILNISDEVITLSDSPEWLICEKLGVNHDWRRQDNFWS